MTDAPTLSASQLELWKLCPRRWYHTYIEGRREVSGDAATAGTKIHDLIEKYLRDGDMPDPALTWDKYEIGKVATAMLVNLPPAGSVKDVELKLDLVVDGINYTGRIDAVDGDTVYDQKSTSALRYAKSAEDLENDIQAMLYARWLDRDGTLVWNYGQTKGPAKTRKVELKVLRDDIRIRFEKIVTPVAKQVLAAYTHRDKKRTPQNFDACRRFPPNGCPFKGECLGKTLQIEKDRTMSDGTKMTMVEMLRAKSAGVTAPSNDVVEPDRAAAVAADMKAIEAEQMLQAHVDLINAPNVVRTATPAPVETVDTLPKKTRKKREPMTLEERQAIPANKQQEEALAELSALGQEMDAADNATNGLGDYKALSPLPSGKQVEGKPIRTLYLDCLPLTTPVVHAHVLIAKAAETVCNDLQVLNIKLIDFGKGGGSLAAQLRYDILELEPGFDLAVNTRTVEGREVSQELMSLAQNIVVAL